MAKYKVIGVGSTGGTYAVQNVTVQSSVAITNSGSVNAASLTNPGARGVQLFLDVDSATSSAAATPTLDITVQGFDVLSSAYYALPGATFTQVTTSTGQQVLVIHPDVPNDSGTGFRRRPSVVPPLWRINYSAQVLSSGSTGATYEFTVGGVYIP